MSCSDAPLPCRPWSAIVLLHPPGHVLGVIGDDNVRSRPLDAKHRLQNHSTLIQPTFLRSRLDHRVFSAHTVGSHWKTGLSLQSPYQIQIGKGGLDHHHIRPLLNIHHSLPDTLVRVGGIHLIGTAVSKAGRRFCGVAKGTVEAGDVLRTVGHYWSLDKTLLIERTPYGGDAPVHHVRGRNHVHTRFSQAHRGLGQEFQAQVIVYLAIFPHYSTVTVIHVFTETHISYHGQFRHLILERADSHLHDTLFVVGTGSGGVLFAGDSKQNHALHSQRRNFPGLFDQVGNGQLENPRHRRHGVPHILAKDHKKRIYQAIRVEPSLSNHSAQRLTLAHAPRSELREVHCLLSTSSQDGKTGPAPSSTQGTGYSFFSISAGHTRTCPLRELIPVS